MHSPATPLTPITSLSSTDPHSMPVTLSNGPLSNSNSLKRKRSHSSLYLSSPPPEPYYDPPDSPKPHLAQKADQSTQTGLDLLQTPHGPPWTGRGRSPYKTPVTAVLDGIKNQTARLERFERELLCQQGELDALIGEKRRRLESLDGRKGTMAYEPTPRVILERPSSTSRGRSSSPDKYLTKLALASPPVIPQTFTNLDDPFPQLIEDLVLTLRKGLSDGCIPSEFKSEIEHLQPYADVPDNAYGAMISVAQADRAALWKTAKSITDEAGDCQEEHKDENAWSFNVLRPVFAWEPPDANALAGPAFSRTEFIQTQMLDPKCLSVYGKPPTPVESKKSDFALSFSPRHPEVKKQYSEVQSASKELITLSQMGDDCTSKLVLYLGAEVKKHGGNEAEAQSQVYTWLGSGITKRRQLMKSAAQFADKSLTDKPMPLLGWTIVGHQWRLYIAFGHGNGLNDKVRIVGPVPGCNVATETYYDSFKLLRLEERIMTWARNTYWPWVRDAVLKPLKAEKEVEQGALGDEGMGGSEQDDSMVDELVNS